MSTRDKVRNVLVALLICICAYTVAVIMDGRLWGGDGTKVVLILELVVIGWASFLWLVTEGIDS